MGLENSEQQARVETWGVVTNDGEVRGGFESKGHAQQYANTRVAARTDPRPVRLVELCEGERIEVGDTNLISGLYGENCNLRWEIANSAEHQRDEIAALQRRAEAAEADWQKAETELRALQSPGERGAAEAGTAETAEPVPTGQIKSVANDIYCGGGYLTDGDVRPERMDRVSWGRAYQLWREECDRRDAAEAAFRTETPSAALHAHRPGRGVDGAEDRAIEGRVERVVDTMLHIRCDKVPTFDQIPAAIEWPRVLVSVIPSRDGHD